MKCRFCENSLDNVFVDLVNAPPSNSYLTKDELSKPEVYYPLKLFICDQCFLVQIDEYKNSSEIFNNNYAYFSSYSTSWLGHAKRYVEMITARLRFDHNSQILELASNDGYLLQYFQEKDIPVLGIEPADNVAKAAREKGIETLNEFFSLELAKELAHQGRTADLIIGNNVFAHVPDVNDFVAGMEKILKKDGVITLEFPHLMELIEQNQFDTIYHEHYSYYSLYTSKLIFEAHGLELFDVEQLPTHGGSLRIYGKHKADTSKDVHDRVNMLLAEEKKKGMQSVSYYTGFQDRVDRVKIDLLNFLLDQKREHKQVIAYGAAAKGNTLLSYCGIKNDLIEYVVDASPHKRGKYLPGSHIEIVHEDKIKETKPEYVLILPWNLEEEICAQLNYIKDWKAKFVIPIPELRII